MPMLRCHNDQQLHFVLDQAEARSESLEQPIQLEIRTAAEMVNFRDDQVSRRPLQDQIARAFREK